MKKKMNQFVAILLCLCMCFSLMPVFPALATVHDDESNFTSGHVLRFEDLGDVIKINVSVRNMTETALIDLRLKYDVNDVTFVKDASGTALSGLDKAKNVITNNTSKIAPEVLNAAGETLASETWVKSNDYTDYLPLQYTDTTTLDKTEGILSVELSTKSANLMSAMKEFYVDGFITGNVSINMGANTDVGLYDLYFKKTSGSVIDSDTFQIYVNPDDNTAPEGSAFTKEDTKTIASSDVLMIGFPQPAAQTYPGDITVKNHDNSKNLSGATVTFNDVTYTTNSNGKLLSNDVEVTDLKLEAKEYAYTVTPGSADAAAQTVNTGTFTVTASESTQNFILNSAQKIAASHDFTIKVLDGDNGNVPIEGASVILDGATLTTNAEGVVTTNKPESTTAYTLKINKNGYVSNENGSLKITPDTGLFVVEGDNIAVTQAAGENKAVVTVTLFKTQKQITIPVLDDKNQAVPGAIVTVTANPAGSVPAAVQAQLPKTFTANAEGQALLNLPAGDYLITVKASGYETTSPIALTVKEANVTIGGILADGTVIGGSESAFDAENKATVALPTDELPVAVKGPLYVVEGKWDNEADPTYMNVTVKLQNAKVTMGTFGLRYDTNIFTLADNDFTVDDGSNKIMLRNGMLEPGSSNALVNPLHNKTFGYHMFTWSGMETALGSPSEVDATNNDVLIATYKLAVKPDVKVNEIINNESLFIIPVEETEYQKIAEDAYKKEDLQKEFTNQFWRTVDEQNTADAAGDLQAGRLDAGQALGKDGKKGFYQVFPVVDGGNNYGYDIRTQFVFPNPGNNIRADFSVVDETTGQPIKDAIVTIFNENGFDENVDNVIATVTTNERGEVFKTLSQNTNYKFYVNKVGFWPYPGKTVEADEKKTEALNVAQTTVLKSLTLQAKTYHPVTLFIHNQGNESEESTAKNANLSGNSIAYNGLSYFFNIAPKAGYEWAKEKPATLKVVIKKGNAADNSDKELTATFDKASNSYKLDGTVITGNALGEADLPDTAMDESLKAGDLVISIGNDYFKQAQFNVLATAGAGGSVSSNPAPSDSNGITKTGETITQVLGEGVTESAIFTFAPTPISETGKKAVIDQVLINGIPVAGVQGLDTFDYGFTNVIGNQTISVTFGKLDEQTGDIDPISDPVVTVIGSEFGTVKVTAPSVKDVGTGERMDFTMRKAVDAYSDFTAQIVPAGGSAPEYVIDRVVVDGKVIPNDGSAVTVPGGSITLDASGNLTISNIAAGYNHTVIATFKTKDGPSIQAIVTSSIGDGEGYISPFGIAVYNINETPDYQMKPASDSYQLSHAVIDGTTKVTDITTVDGVSVYRMAPITGDTTIVANFDEVTYEVQLLVQFYTAGSPITPRGKADLTFTRAADNKVMPFETAVPVGGVASATANIPAGTWTVKVHKNGYLDYIITDFTVDGTENGIIYFGELVDQSGGEAVTSAKPVALTIGEANRDGRLIALNDIAQVANGLLTSASTASQGWADLDDNGNAKVEDMSYVKTNFGKYYTEITYDEFKAAAK